MALAALRENRSCKRRLGIGEGERVWPAGARALTFIGLPPHDLLNRKCTQRDIQFDFHFVFSPLFDNSTKVHILIHFITRVT